MIAAIVAVNRNWQIGRNGKLLYHLPQDMKRFQQLTMGQTVLMGRKTLESLPGGKPLPGRHNLVLTRNPDFHPNHVDILHHIDDVVHLSASTSIWVIGGGEIYRQMLPWTDQCLITMVQDEKAGDTSFPNLDLLPDWIRIQEEPPITEKGFTYQFLTYQHI